MTLVKLENLFHVGIVSAEFEQTRAEMERTMGVRWKGGEPQIFPLDIAGERREIEMRVALSEQGPPHFELIEAVPGSIWNTTGLHHLCYWSEDSAGLCSALIGDGWERVLGQPDDDFGYFRRGDGPLLEILPPRLKKMLDGVAMGTVERIDLDAC